MKVTIELNELEAKDLEVAISKKAAMLVAGVCEHSIIDQIAARVNYAAAWEIEEVQNA